MIEMGSIQLTCRYSEKVRQAVLLAGVEAKSLGENYMATEHLMLGLLRQQKTTAKRVLRRLRITLKSIRAELAKYITRGDGCTAPAIEMTPRMKRVMYLAEDEMKHLGHNRVGTEHLLLGLIREGEGLAARRLYKLGVTLEKAREAVRREQDASVEEL